VWIVKGLNSDYYLKGTYREKFDELNKTDINKTCTCYVSSLVFSFAEWSGLYTAL